MLAELIILGAINSALSGKKKHCSKPKQSYNNKPQGGYTTKDFYKDFKEANKKRIEVEKAYEEARSGLW